MYTNNKSESLVVVLLMDEFYTTHTHTNELETNICIKSISFGFGTMFFYGYVILSSDNTSKWNNEAFFFSFFVILLHGFVRQDLDFIYI